MIGQTISHYKILDKLGAGGMGEVFLAEDTDLKRRVALKFLPEELQRDTEARERLLREAQAASSLNHPNVLTIHAVETEADRSFIVMEYVEGDSLKTLVRNGSITFDQFHSISMQICDGMAAAHDAGLVHRDIKSDNIMVTPKGRVKVMDFGLATCRDTDHLSDSQSTMGTMAYMSPEQVQGTGVDQRSDIFSLGVVLYEMITGTLPFGGGHQAAIIYAIAHENPEPLARYKSDISPGMEALIAKALDKDPGTRYQSAADLNADLRREKKLIDSDDSLPAYTSGPVRTSRQPNTLRRILVPGTALAIIALLFLLAKPWEVDVHPTHEASAEQNRLAVMYFENLADPADSQRLGKIVTNLLITDLSESHYVRVVSNQRLYDILKRLGIDGVTSVDQEAATQVAKEAEAKWMLLGSILQADPYVLTAQLVEVSTGNVIASQRISGGPNDNIFPLVDRLTQEIKNDLALPADAQADRDPAVANVTTYSTEAYGHYLDGVEYLSKLYTEEARECFEKALAIDSTFAIAHYRLSHSGLSYVKQRECIAKAVENIERVTNKEKLLILAGQAAMDDDADRAIALLEELIAKYPDDKGAYLQLAYGYRERDDHMRAIEYLERAIAVDPMFKDAVNLLAYEYDKIGEFQKSIWAINEYLELAPNEANPYDTRGDLYAFNGQPDMAMDSYRQALTIKPDFAHSQRKLGHMQLFMQEYEHAEAAYRKLASFTEPGARSDGRLSLAVIPTYRGRFAEALEALDRGIAADELDGADRYLPTKYFNRAAILSYQGEYTKALAAIDEGVNHCDTAQIQQTLRPELMRVMILTDQGKTGEAKKIAAAMETMMVNRDSVYQNYLFLARGLIAESQSDHSAAAQWYERALAVRPTFAARVRLGKARLDNGQLGEAVEILSEALKRYDDERVYTLILNVKAHYWLGLAYEQSGWGQKAAEQYQTFLGIWKDADSGIVEIDDANARLTRLQTQS